MADRKQILFGITDPDDKLFLSKMCDIAERSENAYKVMFSKFLDPRQVLMTQSRLSAHFPVEFFGGYDGAERRIAAFGETFGGEIDYPIAALKISPKSGRTLSHRDYLGSILALGIKRELLGDIAVTDGGAAVFVTAEIADFVEMNLKKVASDTVRVSRKTADEDVKIERNFKEIDLTVSSLRLDCVLSAATGMSRSKSAEAVEEGLCTVNYSAAKDIRLNISDGDILSVRGFGKMIIQTDKSLTKKGRIHIKVKKYI